jgi:hypothetical protein
MKKLENYKQTKPEQLLLFELTAPEDKKYSNSIELYDAIPKYFWGSVTRENGRHLPSLLRSFEFRGRKYKVKITPARMEDKNGVEIDFYPSQREELVEDALRKLACDGSGVFLDDQLGVVFTLYQLQKELTRMGHGYNIAEIKDALYICAKTNMEVKTDDGQNVVLSSLFETLGLQTREEWKEHGKKSKAFVRFNILVTSSIKSRTFRQLNYEKCMSYKRSLARWFHKRISHIYIQADPWNNYGIRLSTIIQDSGIEPYSRIQDNIRRVKEALEEMKEQDILSKYECEYIYSEKRKNKIEDAKFLLFPHPYFISEMLKANKRQKQIKSVSPSNNNLATSKK